MLGETYIFFADMYFLQNFCVKIAVLWLTIKILKIRLIKPVIKIMGIASVGTLFEIAGLFFVPKYEVFLAIVHLIEVPGMIFLLIGKQRGYLWRGIVSGYFFVLMINSVVEILWNLIGYGWLYPMLVLAGNIIVVLLVCYFLKRWKMSKGIYPVDIYRPEIIWTAKGYYDSGNRLKDPYTGKGVHIISAQLAEKLELSREKKVCIPYQSLGNAQGLLDVYYVENLKIRKESQWIELGKVPIGVAESKLFSGKEYEMILNEEVW